RFRIWRAGGCTPPALVPEYSANVPIDTLGILPRVYYTLDNVFTKKKGAAFLCSIPLKMNF
ncbi:hypothetical protein, partial [Allofournierella sp. CML151]|uniref:hypothetical protein n=1 Tax=Allofournierella sp. CML151 TaxID=2998082 RepID=UPI0022EAC43C